MSSPVCIVSCWSWHVAVVRVLTCVHCIYQVMHDSVCLCSDRGQVLATYPAEKLAFSACCPDDRRFFGLVTMQATDDNGHYSNGRDEEGGLRTSCHVFIVDPELCHHQVKKLGDRQQKFALLPQEFAVDIWSLKETFELCFEQTAGTIVSTVFHLIPGLLIMMVAQSTCSQMSPVKDLHKYGEKTHFEEEVEDIRVVSFLLTPFHVWAVWPKPSEGEVEVNRADWTQVLVLFGEEGRNTKSQFLGEARMWKCNDYRVFCSQHEW